jgi:hypothetical protein
MSSKVTALLSCLLVDGMGSKPTDDGTVLVEGSKISDVGPSEQNRAGLIIN